jgi:mono/diheme cytochrome c family protein/glucose/arabinose dehydrogenase
MSRFSFNFVFASVLLALLALSPFAHAQRGDKKGEVQAARVPKEKIPPSPPLSPEAELKTFKVQPGFRVELFASEPMVEVPVAGQFDVDGRLWVVEMRAFMPNADGLGEDKPIGRVSILEDTDGDGRADKRTVFVEGLVMPRGILHVRGGVLIAEPPNLWFYPNVNDKPGPRVAVAKDFGSQQNPEHTANSLVLGLDNWIYSLYHPWRYRFMPDPYGESDGAWKREAVPQRVQWGHSQDDFGRLYYTSNSDQLRGDLLPPHYFAGARNKPPGIGVQIAKDQSTWPARVNPGVNRAYQPQTLRADGTLAKFTAACGTCIYRDEVLPGCNGNAFICEPSANLIRRNLLTEQGGVVTATNAHGKAEFLTSTDELFRPVNLYTGPDGALFVIDMYHGIIQHRVFLTSYLRGQSEERGLDKVIDKGRIWRVVPDGKPARATKPKLTAASSADLVQTLAHPNGWWRDTAQRLLVEKGDVASAPALRELAASAQSSVARLHSLWTLEGIRQLNSADLDQALASDQPRVRATAVRLAEPLLKSATNAALREKVYAMADDKAAEVQIQTALTLGLLLKEAKATNLLATLSKKAAFALARDAASYSIAAVQPPKPVAPDPKARPLTADEQKRFASGKDLYEQVCLACHQAHGLGQPGLAPPLAGSEWVAGSDKRIIRIVLQGMRGKIKVKGEEFELDMPSLGVLDDDTIAAILTYVRREWGHGFNPVTPATVKQVRDETEKREDAWTVPELLKVP